MISSILFFQLNQIRHFLIKELDRVMRLMQKTQMGPNIKV